MGSQYILTNKQYYTQLKNNVTNVTTSNRPIVTYMITRCVRFGDSTAACTSLLAACRLRKGKTDLSNANKNTLFVVFNYLNYRRLMGKNGAHNLCIICKNNVHNPEKSCA